jgi:hypothetical protein
VAADLPLRETASKPSLDGERLGELLAIYERDEQPGELGVELAAGVPLELGERILDRSRSSRLLLPICCQRWCRSRDLNPDEVALNGV